MPTRTNLIASGSSYSASATFVVDASAPATVHINGASPCQVVLQRSDGTNFYPVKIMYSPGETVTGIGTYRVVREGDGPTFQVDVEK